MSMDRTATAATKPCTKPDSQRVPASGGLSSRAASTRAAGRDVAICDPCPPGPRVSRGTGGRVAVAAGVQVGVGVADGVAVGVRVPSGVGLTMARKPEAAVGVAVGASVPVGTTA